MKASYYKNSSLFAGWLIPGIKTGALLASLLFMAIVPTKLFARNGYLRANIRATSSITSSNANLVSIGSSINPLSPLFSSATTSYTISAGNVTTSMTVKPVTSDPNATLTVNGSPATSGVVTAPISLNVGNNVITVTVTAQDGITTKTYQFNVTRAASTNAKLASIGSSINPLSPLFSSATTGYSLNVGNATQSMTVKPVTADGTATLTVNGVSLLSGTVSAPISLAVGSNTIAVAVTAQDGTTTRTYSITVTRAPSSNANLISIGSSSNPLNPAFTGATTSYSLNVSNATLSMTVKPVTSDPNATLTINGAPATSGTVSAPISLAVGSNTVSIAVTAQDGTTTKTYTITVTRALSPNADLVRIGSSVNPLSPLFASTTTDYSIFVPGTTTSMTVKPVTSEPNATIKVNGVALASGTVSAPIALAPGNNAIVVAVTAQDGVTTKTYTITVNRAGPNEARLASVTFNPDVILNPIFSSDTYGYSGTVPFLTSSVTPTPTAVDPAATIVMSGNDTIRSGNQGNAIPLKEGLNSFSFNVTAEDDTTSKNYLFTIYRTYREGGVNNPTTDATLATDGVNVHQAISPNGDGVNDYLHIDQIASYPDNKLTITNRNGQLIFEATGYDNTSKVFDGHSSKNGQMQLPGTYYYALDYTINGVIKHKTGYLVLKY